VTDPVKLKERATEAFAKGKFAKAGELYLDYCKAMPRDLQSRLRMGDAWARAHQKDRAIDAYKEAAEGFAKAGFLPRAIAASKLILELDPAHQGVQQMLADLYARRGFGDGGGKRTRAAGPAVARALEGGPKPIELAEDLPEPEPAAAPEPILLSTPKSAHRQNPHQAIELPPEPVAPESEVPLEEPPAAEIEVALEEPIVAMATEVAGKSYELELPDEPEVAADAEAPRKSYEIELPEELSQDLSATGEEPAAASEDAAPPLEL
jgi:hypothetical protein